MPLTFVEDSGTGLKGSRAAASADLIVAMDGGPTEVRVSADQGATFDTHSLPAAPATFYWEKLLFAGEFFFLFCDDGETFLLSVDGEIWDEYVFDAPLGNYPNSLTYKDGVYIATVYGAGFVLRSVNGYEWTEVTIDTDNWSASASGLDRILIISPSGEVRISLDLGLTWGIGGGLTSGYEYLVFAQGYFQAFANGDTNARRTTTGSSWTDEAIGSAFGIYAACAYGNGGGSIIIDNNTGYAYSEDGGDNWALGDLADDGATNNSYAVVSTSSAVFIGRSSDNAWIADLPVPSELMADSIVFSTPIFLTNFGVTLDGVALGQTIDITPGAIARAFAAFGSSQSGVFEGTVPISDSVALEARATFIVRLLLEEGLALGGTITPTYTQIARVVARLLIQGLANNYAEALAMITESLVVAGVAEALRLGQASDTLAMRGLVETQYTLVAALLDRLVAAGAASPGFTLTMLIEDRFVLNADLANAVELHALLRDSVGFAMTLSFDNGEYIAWVLNTEGNALSRYVNYPFNSFAKIGNTYYGAASDGIHALDGDTDNDLPIDAKLRLGLNQLGDRKLKRLPEVYIGYSSDGTLLMKVITIDERTANKVAAIYTLPTRGAVNTREHRFEPGKGLRSVDWDFEIHNVDGADFDLASIEFYPLAMSRRTRG